MDQKMQLKIQMAEKKAQATRLEAQATRQEAEVLRLKLELLEAVPLSKPFAHKTAAQKGAKPNKVWRCVQYTADDAACIIDTKCHTRRVKNVGGVWHFHQCRSNATEKHGYCQGCLDKTESDFEKAVGAVSGLCGEGGRVHRDGDIRLWGGEASEVAGWIDPRNHIGFLTQNICENDPNDTKLHYIKKVPKSIRHKYGLPDAPVVELTAFGPQY
jgi:hypothetical protein